MWFKASEASVEPRNHAQCVVVGKRQMLVVGGKNEVINDKDRTPQGLSLFDMTDLTWKRNGKYDADAADYKSPQVVRDWYEGKNLSAALDWTSDEVRGMFLVKEPAAVSTDTTPSPTSSATPGAKDSSGGSSPAGPIAGGVVGGVAVLGLIAGLVYYYCFRAKTKSKKASAAIGTTVPGEEDHKPPAAEEQHLSSSNKTKELPTEPSARELYVSPEELAASHERWELDAEGEHHQQTQGLNSTSANTYNHQVYELGGERDREGPGRQ